MADEYIKRSDALLFALFCIRNIFDSNVSLDDKFKEIPSADVAEVRRGEWIKEKDGCVVCSICGYPDEINLISYEFMYNNFCANCGADMRKDGGQ